MIAAITCSQYFGQNVTSLLGLMDEGTRKNIKESFLPLLLVSCFSRIAGSNISRGKTNRHLKYEHMHVVGSSTSLVHTSMPLFVLELYYFRVLLMPHNLLQYYRYYCWQAPRCVSYIMISINNICESIASFARP